MYKLPNLGYSLGIAIFNNTSLLVKATLWKLSFLQTFCFYDCD